MDTFEKIFAAVTEGRITMAQATVLIGNLKVEKTAKSPFRVSKKKAVSIYLREKGWPVTVFKDELKYILDNKEALEKFVVENDNILLTKEQADAEKAADEKAAADMLATAAAKADIAPKPETTTVAA